MNAYHLIFEKYKKECTTFSDIHYHLPTLRRYGMECDSILELGVRGCVSTWAFVLGLLDAPDIRKKKLIVNDIEECEMSELKECLDKIDKIQFEMYWQNDLTLELSDKVDLTFIDTWHAYGQLIRELEKFHTITNKYIILHDIQSFGHHGEPLKEEIANKYREIFGMTTFEIRTGLLLAIEDFLKRHAHEWRIKEINLQNNGLMVLERV